MPAISSTESISFGVGLFTWIDGVGDDGDGEERRPRSRRRSGPTAARRATTCVGGRVRAALAAADGRTGSRLRRRAWPAGRVPSSGVRSLAKASPRCVRVGSDGAPPSGSPSLGRLPGGPLERGRAARRPRVPGQYARAVTPEQLQDVVRTAVCGGRRPRRAAPSRPRPRSSSSGRRTASTATTPPTSPCGWPSRPAGRRARWPRCSPRSCARTPASPAVDVAGPGFLNITLAAGRARADRGQRGHRRATRYGRTDALAGQRLNLEFVSANPTGPVHIGGTRWAAVGDALGRLLEASGADVTREYYLNDAGAQIDRFARSLQAAAHGRAGARGRLRRRLHRRHRRPGRGRRARPARPARRRAARAVPRRAASS